MKKKPKTVWIIVLSIVLLLVLQTLPVFFPRPLGSKVLEDERIRLYYVPGDEKGANEVFDLLNEKSDEIYKKMNFKNTEQIEVNLYPTQWQLAIREAGFATLIIAPPWYIGDSHNGNIMMVSPYTPVSAHNHDSILMATLHELVHSIVFHINPELSYFWDNGLATYLAGQTPEEGSLRSMPVPSITDMHTDNGLVFGNMGGYAFSYDYIEFLEQTYGLDKVVDYASGNGDYVAVFGFTEEEIYQQWAQSLNQS
jgi:hypothetical protein